MDYLEEAEREQRVNTMAREIADSCARADIECNIPHDHDDALGRHWFDTSKAEPGDAVWLPQILEYLTARGLLLRDPERRDVVSFEPAPVGPIEAPQKVPA